MKLIDANDLLKRFEQEQNAYNTHGREFASSFLSSGGEISTEWYCVEDIVENMPEAIIRCRDCKHNPTEAWFGCPMAGTKRRTEDTFCSFGERREKWNSRA